MPKAVISTIFNTKGGMNSSFFFLFGSGGLNLLAIPPTVKGAVVLSFPPGIVIVNFNAPSPEVESELSPFCAPFPSPEVDVEFPSEMVEFDD